MGSPLHLLARKPLLAALAPILLAAPAAQIAISPSATVQLLSINDFHGNIETPAGGTAQFRAGTGGAEYLAAHVARAVAEAPDSIFVGAGDLIGASPLTSGLFHDEPAVLALNAMHLAVSSVGNHEFDKGTDELLRIQHGGCHPVDGCRGATSFPGASYEYLAANVIRQSASGKETLFPATAVRTVGGVKIGFIGEVLADTPHLVQPAGIRDLTFLDEASTANTYAAELKRQGVNAIVLLIHQGGRQGLDESGDANGCANFNGGIVPILDRLTPDIKVVVAGHAHVAYICTIGGRTVVNSGAYGRALTRISLTIDRATDEIRSVSARNEIVTHDVTPAAAEAAIIATYRPLALPLENRVVGTVSSDLTKTAGEAGESPLGDIIADGQLEAADAPGLGADVAFMNPGGIRVSIPFTPSNGRGMPGGVTFGTLYTVQPFSNMLYIGTMTGAGIKDLLEEQFHANGSRTVLQVSKGFTYTYRGSAAPGQHVVAGSMRLNGAPVGPATPVRVVASDFLFYGGDGFGAFEAESKIDKHVSGDLDAFVAYFRKHSPVAPPPQNRITALP